KAPPANIRMPARIAGLQFGISQNIFRSITVTPSGDALSVDPFCYGDVPAGTSPHCSNEANPKMGYRPCAKGAINRAQINRGIARRQAQHPSTSAPRYNLPLRRKLLTAAYWATPSILCLVLYWPG